MNNEEKIMQILESIAGDVSELKKGQTALETHMNGLEKGQDILARQVSTLTEDMQEVRQSQVRMENELTEKVRALFDAREVQNNVNEWIILHWTALRPRLMYYSLRPPTYAGLCKCML